MSARLPCAARHLAKYCQSGLELWPPAVLTVLTGFSFPDLRKEHSMQPTLEQQLAGLVYLSPAALRSRYAELFGEPICTGNKAWLVKRIAWRLQALAAGDLSERARRRAAELAHDADLRLTPPKSACHASPAPATLRPVARVEDNRLPGPGTVLT